MAAVVTVNDVLDGHVVLNVECLDRIYLNGYVPNLQVSGQVASFMTAHLGYPIPSPAIMEKMGTAFRKAVDRFAAANEIPVVRFGKDDRKIEVMRRYLAKQAKTGRAGVAAIGVAQEFAPVFTGTRKGTVNLRSCGSSANHISLIRHTRPGESRRRTGENRPRIAQVDSAAEIAPELRRCAWQVQDSNLRRR